jgi:hypothetical protein
MRQQSHRAGSRCCFYTLQQCTHIHKYTDIYKHTHRDQQTGGTMGVSILLAPQKCERVKKANSRDHPVVCVCVCVCVCLCVSLPAVKPRYHCHTTRCESYATAHHKNLATSNFQPYVTTCCVHSADERLEPAAMPLGPLVTGFLKAQQHSLGSKCYVTSLDCWT